MKKLLVLICLSVLLFFSCVSIKAIDESVPEEETARLFTGPLGTVTSYNGISVNWGRLRGISVEIHQIPAGDTTLEIDVDAQLSLSVIGNTTYRRVLRVKGALFRYNFQPMKEYYFDVAEKDNKYGLVVYAWNYGDKNAGSGTAGHWNAHLVEFVPFLNVVVN